MGDNLWDILIDAGLTEADIEAIMGLGALEGERGLMDKQYETAQGLRQTQWPQGRQAGRVYRKAHPLEHISAGLDRAIGGYQSNQAMDRQKQILQEQAHLRNMMLSAMLKRGAGAGSGSPLASPAQVAPAPVAGALQWANPNPLR